jgi:hypothetical protein
MSRQGARRKKHMNIHGVTDRFRRLTAVIAAVLPTLVNAADNDYRVFKPRSEGPYRAVGWCPSPWCMSRDPSVAGIRLS